MNCRFCKNYDSTGRHGGYCNQLSVPVQSKWAACKCFLSNFSENPCSQIENLIANDQFTVGAIAN